MTTILVVDNSAVDRRFVGGLLEKGPEWTVEYAENGAEALAGMEKAVPDLVVTDLQMPEMDGLELVKAIHGRLPEVPVILMTAYGSEALAQGAASYIPKSQLAERLVNVVAEVVQWAHAEHHAEDILSCLSTASFFLGNDPKLIDPLVALVQQMVVGMGFDDFTGRLQIGVALKEALLNALYRGTLEISFEDMQEAREKMLLGEDFNLVKQRRTQAPYRDRKIFVDVKIASDEAQLVVRDEGPGFDVTAIPEPGDPIVLEPEGGRGLSLMRNLMDDVTYNDVGNEVIMVKRRASDGQGAQTSV